jgi:hypothetical protein
MLAMDVSSLKSIQKITVSSDSGADLPSSFDFFFHRIAHVALMPKQVLVGSIINNSILAKTSPIVKAFFKANDNGRIPVCVWLWRSATQRPFVQISYERT